MTDQLDARPTLFGTVSQLGQLVEVRRPEKAAPDVDTAAFPGTDAPVRRGLVSFDALCLCAKCAVTNAALDLVTGVNLRYADLEQNIEIVARGGAVPRHPDMHPGSLITTHRINPP